MDEFAHLYVLRFTHYVLDAPVRFTQTGDAGDFLGRAFGEKRIQVFGGNAAFLGDSPEGGGFALLLMVGAAELNHPPMVQVEGVNALFLGQRLGDFFGPVIGVYHKTILIKFDGFASNFSSRHTLFLLDFYFLNKFFSGLLSRDLRIGGFFL
jgi:hypothetical protein